MTSAHQRPYPWRRVSSATAWLRLPAVGQGLGEEMGRRGLVHEHCN